jgi:hypothetical protein
MHLGASAKASSALQLLLMMTPDHELDFGFLSWAFSVKPNAKNNANMEIMGKSILIMSPPACPVAIDHQLLKTLTRSLAAAPTVALEAFRSLST